MTVSSIKVKVLRTPVIKVKLIPKFPSSVTGDIAIKVVKANGAYTIEPDYSGLSALTAFDPSQEQVLVYNPITTAWNIISLATLINNAGSSVRVVTEAGDITVGVNTRVLIMNRTANESPSKINLPAASLKVGDILCVDWKGNAGTFPHTIYTSGSDKLNGNLSSWRLDGDGASVRLSPISTLGYAV